MSKEVIFTFSDEHMDDYENLKRELGIKGDKDLINTALSLLEKKVSAEKKGLDFGMIDRKNKKFYSIA